MLPEKTFIDNGFSMNYGEGTQTGAPLIFIHGATLWWMDFAPLIPTMIQQWHVYACDMRGHGKSSRTPGKYRTVDFAVDIIEFIQKQVQEPVVLVSHSLGGVHSLLVAAQIPEMVRAVILIDPATVARNTPLQSIGGPGDWVIGIGEVFAGKLSAKDFILASNPEIDEAGLRDTESMIRSVDPEFISVLVNNTFLDSFSLEQALTKVVCPTLLLYGNMELGSIVPETEADFLKQHIPQMVAYQIKDAGHSPHWEQTETTLEHISDFLKTI